MTADEGYDDQKRRQLAPDHDIRPLTKLPAFTAPRKAWNARLASNLYHGRNMNEIVNTAIEQNFYVFVGSRLWWKQFRELVLDCIVRELEGSLARSHEGWDYPRFREEGIAEYGECSQQFLVPTRTRTERGAASIRENASSKCIPVYWTLYN